MSEFSKQVRKPRYYKGVFYSGEPIVFGNRMLEAPPLGDVVQNYNRIEAYIREMASMSPYDLAIEFGFPERTVDAVVLDPKSEESCQWFFDRHRKFCEIARIYRNHGKIVGDKRSYFEYYKNIAMNMLNERLFIEDITRSHIQVMQAEIFDKGAILIPLNERHKINENPDLICQYGGIVRTLEVQSDLMGYMIFGNKWNKDGHGNLKPVTRGFFDFRSGKYRALTSYKYNCGNGREMLPLFVNIDTRNWKVGLVDFEFEDTVAQYISKHYAFGGKPANRMFVEDIGMRVFPFANRKIGERPFEFLKQCFVNDVAKRPSLHQSFEESLYDRRIAEGCSSVNDWFMESYKSVGRIQIPVRNAKVLRTVARESLEYETENNGQMMFRF